jgi:hypothetical protein
VTHLWPSDALFRGMATASGPPFALAYDQGRGKTVLFSATDNAEPMGTTLEWDGTSWVDRTPADPAMSPPSRWGHAMAYDAARAKTVLFGGIDSAGPRFDVWEWDGQTGTWVDRTPTAAGAVPDGTVRERLSMAWNAATGTVSSTTATARSAPGSGREGAGSSCRTATR